MRALALCGIVALTACNERHARNLHPVNAVERLAYLRAARVWEDVDVERRDLLAGPHGKGAFEFEQEVRCRFVEPEPEQIIGGSTSKFVCARPGGERLVVKYGSKEVQAEVLGTRLLWALGFEAPAIYPVRVRCSNCPEDPWAETRGSWRGGGARGDRHFADAIVKRQIDGVAIEEHDDQGWTWEELVVVEGSTRAELDALRLLAAFMQHGDSKAENHELFCPRHEIGKNGRCKRPLLAIADAGSTFGGGAELIIGSLGPIARAHLSAWTAESVWRDKPSCRARLAAQFGSVDPLIGEGGRALLARQLSRLSDDQLRDLFRAARVEKLDETIDGHAVTVEHWVAAFKSRRAEIVNQRCATR